MITRVIQRPRPRKSATLVTGAILILAAGLSTASVLATWLTDSGTVDAQISTQLAVLDEVFAKVRSEYDEVES